MEQEILPIPKKDDRFLFLYFRPANPEAKRKQDDDYKSKIVSNDKEIDIFDVPDNSFLQDAKLNLNDIKPFVKYTDGVAVFDLEWIGADGGEAKGDGSDIIVAIGFKNRGKYYIGCRKDRTEIQLLQWFFKQLRHLKHIHTLAGHGAYGFFRNGVAVPVDYGMIYERCKFHKISKICPWKPAQGDWSTYHWNNAIVNGKQLEVPAWDCKEYQLIDTYPQTVAYDFLINKLTSYSLKNAPVQFGLRDESERQFDIGADVYKYWNQGDTKTIITYLMEDLDDTELLFNYLIPQKYFMKSYMDWDLKRITTTGTGSFWLQYYKKQTGVDIPRTRKCGYKGALTYYSSGFYKNCCKFDYSGLYPSIMLTYLISIKWDKDYFLLKALRFLINHRKSIKKTKAFIDYDNDIETSEGIDAYGQQLTAKILANSLYGALALVDPYAAAAVTAYGRQLIRFMIEWLDSKGLETYGCFGAGTKVLTSDGDKNIETLVGKTTYVLNKNRDWVPVEFKSYGVQQIYKLKLKKGNKELIINTTGNHNWVLESGEIKTTVELHTRESCCKRFDKIENNLNADPNAKWNVESIEETNNYENVFCCEEPLTHTFTLTNGVLCGNCDTDGSILGFKNDTFETEEERHLAFKKLEEELNEALPGETKVEYEEYIPFVYIPPNVNNKKEASIELAKKLNSMDCYDVDPNNLNPGLSKNYIYFVKKGDKFKKVFKGKFKKRGKSWLQSKFVMEFVEKIFYEGEEAAKDYVISVRDAIANGELEIEKVRETKLVSKAEKTLPLYGLENSQKYTIHYIWSGETSKRRYEWKLCIPTTDPTKPYDPDFYLDQFNEKILPQLFVDIPPVEREIMKIEIPKDPEVVERLMIINGQF